MTLTCDLVSERGKRTELAGVRRTGPQTLVAVVPADAGVYCQGNVYTADGRTLPFTLFTAQHIFSFGVIHITFTEEDPNLSLELREAFELAA